MTGDPWQHQAACRGADPDLFFSQNPGRQLRAVRDYCDRCPVADPCLVDALAASAYDDRGVRGGTTRTERDRIRHDPTLPTGRDPVTIANLRRLLDEERPDVARHPAPWTPRRAARAAKENTTVPTPTTLAEAADSARQAIAIAAKRVAAREDQAAEADAPRLPGGAELADLLAWARDHTDTSIRKHAERVRESLGALAERSAADAELERIARERAELEARLAELNERAQQLNPGAQRKTKTPRDRDHDPKEVRAWAAANGYEVAPLGRVPADVVEAWRQANTSRIGAR